MHLEAHAAHARMQLASKHFPLVVADYRWALATVLGGWPSLEESPAA